MRSPLFWSKEIFNRSMSKLEEASWNTSLTFHDSSGFSLSSNSNHSQRENLELECLNRLKRFFRETSSRSIPDEVIFRFACYYDFQYYDAFVALQDYHNNRRLHLRMVVGSNMLTQFQTKTLFPLVGLKTRRNDCDVIYMRPSRYFPSNKGKTSDLVDNLCYVLNDLSQTKEQCRNGVALVANMNDWTMRNFSHDYCQQFLQALQGKQVPTKVQLFLIVNPPRWFGQVWRVMRPMLSKDFARKVYIIKERRLGDFLMDGYEQFLPDEFANGWKNTDEMLEDLLDLKQYEDDLKEL